MIDSLLGPWKYLLYAAIVAAFVGALVYAKQSYDEKQQAIGAAPYIKAIAAQKLEAARVLEEAKRRAAAEAAETQIRTDGIVKRLTDEKSAIETKFANLRVTRGIRLRDPEARCWTSGGGPGGTETKTPSSSEGTSGGVELSERGSDILWNLFRDTEITIAQYETCKAYAASISEKE